MEKLECFFCRKQYPLDIFFPFCPRCSEPLLVPTPSRRRTFSLKKKYSLEQFLEFLPLSKVDLELSLGEGNTPLVPLNRIRTQKRLPFVFAKNESTNPTASFKDRGTSVAIQKAVSLGLQRVGTVSTGNMAASTAAYAARAGVQSVIFVKKETSPEKVLSTNIYRPLLVKIRGDYSRLFYKSFDIGKKYGIYFMNSVDPFRIEGYKATGFEIFFQLGRRLPQYVFVPVSSGGHLIGLIRAFHDLRKEGLTQSFPRFIGIQARGCAPLAQAYARGQTKFKEYKNPNTIAHAISNPNPPGGNIALELIRSSQGMILSVSDEEILTAQKWLAECEGIFCDPASATTLAGLLRLSKTGKLNIRDKVVLIITGSGLKTLGDLEISDTNIPEIFLSSLDKQIPHMLL
ncbi:MAG: threonine synthase [Candidatus Aminicenantales bacterium]